MYFMCEVTDDEQYRRVVGFDAKIHQKLATFHDKKIPVAIGNCQIKESTYSPNLEVVMRNSSSLDESTLTFAIDPDKLEQVSSAITELRDLPELANFNRVTVQVKIITAFDPTTVKDLTKQEYIIADATASSKIICWEENVGLIEEGHSYKLSGLNVRTFRNEKYLSVGKD